jgi:hypothetical protein
MSVETIRSSSLNRSAIGTTLQAAKWVVSIAVSLDVQDSLVRRSG